LALVDGNSRWDGAGVVKPAQSLHVAGRSAHLGQELSIVWTLAADTSKLGFAALSIDCVLERRDSIAKSDKKVGDGRHGLGDGSNVHDLSCGDAFVTLAADARVGAIDNGVYLVEDVILDGGRAVERADRGRNRRGHVIWRDRARTIVV